MKANGRISDDQLRELLSVPLTPKQVAQKVLGTSNANAEEEMRQRLARMAQSGTTHGFPPERKGRARRYAAISPTDWVSRRILDEVNGAGGKVTPKGLKKSLRNWEVTYYDGALGSLIRQGKLHHLTVRYKYIVSFVPTPWDYLLDCQITTLKEILKRVNRRRAKPLSLDEVRSFLDGSVPHPPTAEPKITEETLHAWYKEDLPRLGGITTVPIPWTWERYSSWRRMHDCEANLSDFRQMLERLSQAGKIELVPHSFPSEIPPEHAALVLSGPGGEVLYYWRWR